MTTDALMCTEVSEPRALVFGRYGRRLLFSLGNLKFIDKLWWNFVPGVTIILPWPKDSMTDSIISFDPNDYYRPWLEKNVGRQHWDWNWGISTNDEEDIDVIVIKFRKKYAKYATMAKLIWS